MYTLSLVSTLVASLFAVVLTQSTLPPCAENCLVTVIATSGCDISDISCICGSTSFIPSLTSCLEANCTTSDIQSAIQFGEAVCGAPGTAISNQTMSMTASPSATGSAVANATVNPTTASYISSVISSIEGNLASANASTFSAASSVNSAASASSTASASASGSGTASASASPAASSKSAGEKGATIGAWALGVVAILATLFA